MGRIDVDATVDTFLAALTEADATARTRLLDPVWAEDGRLIDPPRTAKGRRGVDQLATVLLAGDGRLRLVSRHYGVAAAREALLVAEESNPFNAA
jgi:hypothetical protein